MNGHIAVVDDDKRIRILISKFLQKNGYVTSQASNIKELIALQGLFVFDLIILDVMMPKISGIEYLQNKQDSVPVILLTALGDVDDRINGLASGADDYIAKPFDPQELLLRVQNILKRLSKIRIKNCAFGEFTFELLTATLRHGENVIKLTTNEIKIMQELSKQAGIVVEREELLKSFPNITLRTIDVMINRLRAKIESDSKAPKFLQTIRNKGYVLWGNMV